jgi:peptidoglycan hydrolase-like protein with peptidoglycan-binding domain
MKRILSAIATLCIGAGLVLTTGGTASAATPACTSYAAFDEVGTNVVWVPVASTFNTSCHLQRGYANSGVKQLQWSMNACYGESLVTDGIFGSATEAALKRVQKRIGVTADGVYGPYTRDRMLHQGSRGQCFRFNGPGGY